MSNCLWCNKEVKTGRKFCNQECLHSFYKQKAIDKYYNNPKICLNCGKIISYEKNRNNSGRIKFCSQSCAASYNNLLNNNKDKSLVYKISENDFTTIINNSKSYIEIVQKLGYKKANKHIKDLIQKRVKELNLNFTTEFNFSNKKGDSINFSLTKKEVFSKSKNWQSARTCIRKIASKIFSSSGNSRKCIICGYDKHIEIAHIKSISSFSDDSLISEINDINNLVALCPNHHWEFDNGVLSKEDIISKINNKKD